MVRATGSDPVSASDSAAVLKTAVFAFHHARTLKVAPAPATVWTLERCRGFCFWKAESFA